MTSLWQLKRFEARIYLFKSLDCPLALAAAGMNQRFTRYPPVINHNLGWCNYETRLSTCLIFDSYHETTYWLPLFCLLNLHSNNTKDSVIHVFQRICDFQWNRLERILCSLGAIRLPAEDIMQRWLNTNFSLNWSEHGNQKYYLQWLFNFDEYIREFVYFFLLCVLNVTPCGSVALFELS